MFDIRLCGKPMGKPGKTQETFHTVGEAANTKWRWYSHPPWRRKYLIKSSSAKISRRIFSEGSLDSSCKESPLQRDCHYYLEWASYSNQTLNELLFNVDFSTKTFSQQQFLRPDFLRCDIEQLFSQVFWGLLCDRLIELLWKPFRNSSEAAAGLSKYQTFNFALIWTQEKSYSMSPDIFFGSEWNIFVGGSSIFCGSRNIFVGAAGRKEAAYRGPPDVGLLTCTSIIFNIYNIKKMV